MRRLEEALGFGWFDPIHPEDRDEAEGSTFTLRLPRDVPETS